MFLILNGIVLKLSPKGVGSMRVLALSWPLAVAQEVTAPLRSGPLQWHLQWDSLLSLAQTVRLA